MKAYLVKRLLLMIPTLLGTTILIFCISRAAPGDPLGLEGTESAAIDAERVSRVREAQSELYGLDAPVHIQYLRWLWRVVRLDFGYSLKHHRPVMELIKERVWVTVTLNAFAFLIIFSVSFLLGILSAVRHRGIFESVSSFVVILLWSVPIMLMGQLLIGFFAHPDYLYWFPSGGLSSIQADELGFFAWLGDRLRHMVLPVLCLSYTGIAYVTMQVKGGMLDSLGEDYVITARAKGLSELVVVVKHAFRNSIIRIITIMGTLLGGMFAGSVIVEKIFSIKGMGLLAYEAVTMRDYNVIMGVTTIAAFLNVAGLLLADIGYRIADPRICFKARS